MPNPVNRIAEHSFISMQGEATPPRRRLDVESRNGVDGVALWDTGKKGQPFTLTTFVDVADRDAGQDTFGEYLELIEGGLVSIMKADHGHNIDGYQVAVLAVDVINLKTTENMIGGLNVADGEAGATLRCRWQLIAEPD